MESLKQSIKKKNLTHLKELQSYIKECIVEKKKEIIEKNVNEKTVFDNITKINYKYTPGYYDDLDSSWTIDNTQFIVEGSSTEGNIIFKGISLAKHTNGDIVLDYNNDFNMIDVYNYLGPIMEKYDITLEELIGELYKVFQIIKKIYY